MEIGSLAEWFSAIATTAAVILALWPLLRKKKPVVVFTEIRNLESSPSRSYTRIAYANLSDIPGFFILKSCRWANRDGIWHSYNAEYFTQQFTVLPFQPVTVFDQYTRYSYPEEYSPGTKDPFGQIQHEKIAWINIELKYVDKQTGVPAILKISRDEGHVAHIKN